MKVTKTGLPIDQTRRYFYELNFIRAIASLSVVMVHVTAANYHLNDSYLNELMFFLNQISRFGTPLFAVISGFLLYNQAIKGRYSGKRFLQSRFTKIIIPFVIWSFIYLFLKSYDFSEVHDWESLKVFLYDFLLGKSEYHLYFIAVVIQFYILFPLIHKFHSIKQLLFLTIVGLYINYFQMAVPLEVGTGIFNQFIHERAFIGYWIYYFFLGGLFVHFWKPIVTFMKENRTFIILLGITTLVVMIYDVISIDEIRGSTKVINLFNTPLTMIVLTGVYFFLDSSPKVRNVFLDIGNMSMGIYLVHPFVIHFMRSDFAFLLERTRWISLGYIIVVLASIIIVKIIHRLPFGHYIVIIAARRKK